MEIFIFARLHARAGKRDEVRRAMFDLLAHPFQAMLSEQLW